MAHGQALGYSSNAASITVTGVVGGYGGVYTQSLGFYYGFIGPVHGNYGQYAGGVGNYGFGTDLYYTYDGASSAAVGYNAASPNGQVISGGYLGNEMELSNTNAFGVTVLFTGETSSYSFASQQAAGDSAYGEGFAELLYNGYLFQESFTVVEADNLFGVGNYAEAYNYTLGLGFSGGSYFFGYGSPFAGSAYAPLTQYWQIYLPAYGSVVFTEFTETIGAATSERANNGVPAPAAVAPFAVGLLGALRRRNKKS
jgi:hypothetical protein